jgi:single-stranded DNA-binding protein
MSARGYNKCVWGGNLTADPELRTTGAGAPLLIFRIAVTRAYSSNGLTQDDTRYFRAIRWGKTAAAADIVFEKKNPKGADKKPKVPYAGRNLTSLQEAPR